MTDLKPTVPELRHHFLEAARARAPALHKCPPSKDAGEIELQLNVHQGENHHVEQTRR